MKPIHKKLVFGLFFLFALNQVSGQTTIDQDETFAKLLNKKRVQNQMLNFKNVYTIQIFSGNYGEANKIMNTSLTEYKDLDQSIEFNTPSYKIWVGCFENRIDAERNLRRLQTDHPSAFIIKLKK